MRYQPGDRVVIGDFDGIVLSSASDEAPFYLVDVRHVGLETLHENQLKPFPRPSSKDRPKSQPRAKQKAV